MPFSSVSIVEFEQVIVGWETSLITSTDSFISLKKCPWYNYQNTCFNLLFPCKYLFIINKKSKKNNKRWFCSDVWPQDSRILSAGMIHIQHIRNDEERQWVIALNVLNINKKEIRMTSAAKAESQCQPISCQLFLLVPSKYVIIFHFHMCRPLLLIWPDVNFITEFSAGRTKLWEKFLCG